MPGRISDIRITQDNLTVLKQLGLLAELAGTWKGRGFNLIARPNFHDKTDLYLQLNQTRETLKFDPIGSSIPNRGFGQDDIELFGLTYLQQISDAEFDGALHIEPGIWITQPCTTFPPESPPASGQLVARMGSIPHGNALLAEGIAEYFAVRDSALQPSARRPAPSHAGVQCRRIVGKADRSHRAGAAVSAIRREHSHRAYSVGSSP
jgi:hypothetical protein